MLHFNETQKLQRGLSNILRSKEEKNFYSSIAVTYVAYVIRKEKLEEEFKKTLYSLTDFRGWLNHVLDFGITSLAKSFLFELIDNDTLRAVEYALQFEDVVLSDFILHAEDEQRGSVMYATPDSISTLALEILDIKKADVVIDNCSGIGSFLTTACERQPDAKYMGVEINSWACGLASLRTSILGGNIKFEQGNAFDYQFDEKADKAFSDFPLGLRIKSLEGTGIYEMYKSEVPVLAKGTSADWIFNYRLTELIKQNGKAVSIMSLGGLWNTLDKEIRKYFLKQKKIESIIALPSHLLTNTPIAVAMIVFGHGADDGIRFIDATNEYVEGRRQWILSSENIKHIKEALTTDSAISRVVSYDEIANEDFSFSVKRHLAEKEPIKNGVEFSTVIKNIRRGIQLSASELDKVVSSVPTDVQYIVPADIQNGVIVRDLKSLSQMEHRFERYVVDNGNLLIAKNGYPFKIAIARVEQGKTLIASGNLFVIELDESKVDPIYVKAYLESEKGQAELKNILVGTVVPSIGATQLGEVQIPLIELDKQKAIATKYLAAMDNVEYLRRKVEKAENELTEVLSELFSEDED